MAFNVMRREMLMLLGGAAALPIVARAQLIKPIRIGVLASDTNDPKLDVFRGAFGALGWTRDLNVKFLLSGATADPGDMRRFAELFVQWDNLNIVLASGGEAMIAMLQATRTLPIVFTGVVDPVARGFVASLEHPGGNATGFTYFDYHLAGRWLELLKEVAPHVTRVGVVGDPTASADVARLDALELVAMSIGVELRQVNTRGNFKDIERAISALGAQSNGGLIVQSSFATLGDITPIVKLAAEYRVPAIYFRREDVVWRGGLMAYEPDSVDQFRRAAVYVERILRGETAANLPVQNPTRYQLVINLNTAKALGLEVPPALRARADEVVEAS